MIKLEKRYPQQHQPADGNYPWGSYRNRTTADSFDGTPLEVTQANDTLGFHCKLLQEGGVSPSGSPDTTNQSDRYDAMVNVIRREIDETSHDQFVLESDVPDIVRGTLTNSINLTDVDIFNPVLEVGQYHQSLSSYATYGRNYPKESAGSLTVAQSSSEGVNYTYRDFNTGETYICGYYNEAWSSWERIYDTSNPPTAVEVGALSIDGTAKNAEKLNNLTPDYDSIGNTIAVRDAGGALRAQEFLQDGKSLNDTYLLTSAFDTIVDPTDNNIGEGDLLFRDNTTGEFKALSVSDLIAYITSVTGLDVAA